MRQKLAVTAIVALAVVALDPSPETRDYIAYLIALISAALWAIDRVTKK